jgi:hypothetical protein
MSSTFSRSVVGDDLLLPRMEVVQPERALQQPAGIEACGPASAHAAVTWATLMPLRDGDGVNGESWFTDG